MNEIDRSKAERSQIDLLMSAGIEIVPTAAAVGEVLSYLDRGRKINITSSSAYSHASTLAVASRLADEGYEVVPHISAHQVKGGEIISIAIQIERLEINDIFVVRGDEERKGPYASSYEVIRDLNRFEMLDLGFKRIGIAGYPEGLPGITSEKLTESLQKRIELIKDLGIEPYIVTQMCFDPDAILDYIYMLKKNGIDAKVLVGVPGPALKRRIYDRAVICGVGPSREWLKGRINDEFRPEELVSQIADIDPSAVSGYQIFSFNEIARLGEWFGELNKPQAS